MSYKVLYRSYRPKKFKEVVGQKYITKALQNSVIKQKVANAYLFCGPRGTGKTSIANILAMSLNCERFNGEPCCECDSCQKALNNTHPDIIEFDAASHSKVENIRAILEKVNFLPTEGKFKIYIIDEVHMLSNSAANALLKTLEEPPKNTIFILATTDPQKVISTVQSRCQRYDFTKINNNEIKERIIEVLDNESITYEEKAAEAIAKLADGGMRDALTILEQCLAYDENLTYENVGTVYGIATEEDFFDFVCCLVNNKKQESLNMIRKISARGGDLNRFCTDIIEVIKNIIIHSKLSSVEADITNEAKIREIYSVADESMLLNIIEEILVILRNRYEYSDILTQLEVLILKFINNNVSRETFEESNKDKKKILINKKDENEPVNRNESSALDNEHNKKTITVNNHKENEIHYSDDEIARILLSATKEERQKSAKAISDKIVEFATNSEEMAIANILEQCQIFGTSADFILFSCNDVIVKTTANDKEINKKLYFQLRDYFGIDKMPYVLEEAHIKQNIIHKFKELKANGDNEIYVVKKYISDKNSEISNEDKLLEMFGDDLVIKEG